MIFCMNKFIEQRFIEQENFDKSGRNSATFEYKRHRHPIRSQPFGPREQVLQKQGVKVRI